VRTIKKPIWFGAALIAAVLSAVWPLLRPGEFLLSVGTLIALNIIGALSLHLVIRSGLISLGHAAFMGVGSYSCVVAVTMFGLPVWVSILIGMLAPAALAAIIGPIVLRLTGKYFVLVTFLLGEVIRLIFVQWISVTGGANGLSNIPPLAESLSSSTAVYYVCLVAAMLVICLCFRILRSETGRVIDSIRESPRVAEACGVPVLQFKVGVFVLASGLVGLQGSLLAFFLHYIDPNTFGMSASLSFVVMNVLGGMYNMLGPLLGVVFMVALPELLRGYVEWQQIIYGLVLITVMAVFSGGIVGIFTGKKIAIAKGAM
jgi:branched-chain amino acid transport system permease protein